MAKELKVGQIVRDASGTRGRIIRINGPHEIYVEWLVSDEKKQDNKD